jgi:hypothetical protein
MGGISGNNTLILWNDRNSTKKININLSAPAVVYDITTGKGRPLDGNVLNIGNEPLIISWRGDAEPKLSI